LKQRPKTWWESTGAEIESEGGTAIGLDDGVSDRDAVEAGIKSVRQLWGRVDILVATAGGGLGRASSTRSVAPIIEKQGSGKIIITVSSIAGLNPSRDAGYEHYGSRRPLSRTTRGFLPRSLAIRHHG